MTAEFFVPCSQRVYAAICGEGSSTLPLSFCLYVFHDPKDADAYSAGKRNTADLVYLASGSGRVSQWGQQRRLDIDGGIPKPLSDGVLLGVPDLLGAAPVVELDDCSKTPGLARFNLDLWLSKAEVLETKLIDHPLPPIAKDQNCVYRFDLPRKLTPAG